MFRDKSLLHKLVYIAVIAGLFVPVYLIGRPAELDRTNQVAGGGYLAQMRRDADLSQGKLGEIDPASEAMKLGTLGLRGVAVMVLWNQAAKYQRTDQYDNLKATLNQLIKLQPHFIAVWRFQSWNLSYNVSVEFDDYRQRYHWVKKGVEFLIRGTEYNRHSPRLLWDLGWFFGHKIGRSDEKRQFRVLFADDDEFHAELAPYLRNIDETRGASGKYDNWLVAREWYLLSQEAVDLHRKSLERQSPLIFHSFAPMARMYYAMAIEEEGYLDEKAAYEWKRAGDEWTSYGNRDIMTSYGFTIRVNDKEDREEEAEQLRALLEKELPGVRQQIFDDRLAKLEPLVREAYDTPVEKRSSQQHELAYEAEQKLYITHEDVFNEAFDSLSPDKRREVRDLVSKLMEAEHFATVIDRYRQIVNFEYWRTRCAVEQTETAIKARKHTYEADRNNRAAFLDEAKREYDAAWREWAIIFEKWPEMMEDTTAEDLMESINRYIVLLGQMDIRFPPDDFPLRELLKIQQRQLEAPLPAEVRKELGLDPPPGEESEEDAIEDEEAELEGAGEIEEQSKAEEAVEEEVKEDEAKEEEIQEEEMKEETSQEAQPAADADQEQNLAHRRADGRLEQSR